MNRQGVGEAVVFIHHLNEVGEVVDLVEHHGDVKHPIRGSGEMAITAHVVAEDCTKLFHMVQYNRSRKTRGNIGDSNRGHSLTCRGPSHQGPFSSRPGNPLAEAAQGSVEHLLGLKGEDNELSDVVLKNTEDISSWNTKIFDYKVCPLILGVGADGLQVDEQGEALQVGEVAQGIEGSRLALSSEERTVSRSSSSIIHSNGDRESASSRKDRYTGN